MKIFSCALIKAALKCSDYEGISRSILYTHHILDTTQLLLHAVLHVAYAQQKSSKIHESVSSGVARAIELVGHRCACAKALTTPTN